MYKSIALSVAFGALTAAHPLSKRANTLPPVVSQNNQNVLDLALYLEHLEQALYTGGYTSFTDEQYTAEGFPAGFRENVKVIADHETTHAQTISDILAAAGKPVIPPCEYKFPYNSPTSFVDLANMITSTGIGAYLGGGALLTDDPQLLTAASAILTLEARHDTYLRAGLKGAPTGAPFPTAFDTSLPAVYPYNIAQMFIKSCPPAAQLPIPILPKLTLTSPPPSPNLQPVKPGTPLKFEYDPSKFFVKIDPNKPLYIGLINSVTNVTYTEVESCGQGCAQIPVPDIQPPPGGAAFAVLTTFDEKAALTEDQLAQYGTLAGPAEIILS